MRSWTLGFETASDGDTMFQSLVLARIIPPASKPDSLPIVAKIGVRPPAHRMPTRRLSRYAARRGPPKHWRAICKAHVGLGLGVPKCTQTSEIPAA